MPDHDPRRSLDPPPAEAARKLDRLSAFMGAFAVAAVDAADPTERAALQLIAPTAPNGDEAPRLRMALFAEPASLVETAARLGGATLAAARLDFGGPNSPLAAALPSETIVEAAEDAEMAALAAVIAQEATARRCGAQAALNRLLEVAVVLTLRHVIDRGGAETGLFAGLADPRLSRAMVAMHDAPAHAWTAEELAERAGMSRSHFMARFRASVGASPMAYLAHWRLALARRELARGEPVKRAAARAGFASAEAFSRAFHRAHGAPPGKWRPEPP